MADGEERLNLVLLQDLFEFSRSSSQLEEDDENPGYASEPMKESVWGLMPQELVETVLLFLPSSSQARFHTVCKRWREVMTSPAFRGQVSSIALAQGYPFCMVQLPERASCSSNSKMPSGGCSHDLHQVLCKVPIPAGLVLPTESGPASGFQTRVFSHGGLVGVAQFHFGQVVPIIGRARPPEMRCWVLNLAHQTWQEVPRLGLHRYIADWKMWLVGSPGGSASSSSSSSNDFQLFLTIDLPVSTVVYTYSSHTADWQPVVAPPSSAIGPVWIFWTKLWARSRGAFVFPDPQSGSRLVWRWNDGGSVEPLPEAPLRLFALVSNPDLDVVFGYQAHVEEDDPFRLYKLDERTGEWKCLYSGLPQGLRNPDLCICSQKAQVVGHMVFIWLSGTSLIPADSTSSSTGPTLCSYVLAYHILNDSYKWLHRGPLLSGGGSIFTSLVPRPGNFKAEAL